MCTHDRRPRQVLVSISRSACDSGLCARVCARAFVRVCVCGCVRTQSAPRTLFAAMPLQGSGRAGLWRCGGLLPAEVARCHGRRTGVCGPGAVNRRRVGGRNRRHAQRRLCAGAAWKPRQVLVRGDVCPSPRCRSQLPKELSLPISWGGSRPAGELPGHAAAGVGGGGRAGEGGGVKACVQCHTAVVLPARARARTP